MASLFASLVTELTVNLARWRSDMGEAAKISNTRLREIQRNAETTVKNMEKVGRGLQSAFAAVGVGVSIAGIAAALKSAAAEAIEFGDSVTKAAAKTGLSASQFAELANAAKLADVDMETLSKGMRSMLVKISEFESGSKSATTVFNALGLSIKDLQGLRADQQLELIADRLVALRDPADRARAGTELFSRAWETIGPFMLEGAEGIRKAREEVSRLGGALTEDQIQNLAEADQKIKELKMSWSAFARTLTAEVAPALTSVMNHLIGMTPEQVASDLGFALNKLKDLREQQAVYSKPNMDVRVLQDVNRQIDETLAKIANLRANLYALEGPASGPTRRTNAPAAAAVVPGFQPEDNKANKAAKEAARSEMEAPFNLAAEIQAAIEQVNDATVSDMAETSIEIANQNAGWMSNFAENWQKMGDEVKASTDSWATFAEQAARNIQDSFANFLFDPFAEGLNGMLSGFLDTIRRMVAELAAQELLRAFFSWAGGAIGGAAGNFISGLGTRASGGPVTAGGAYLVGERGPELLMMGNRSGVVIPSGAGGGISLTYNIDARGADANRIMAILPPLLKQNKDATISEIMRLQRQGRFA